ncbi:hypothetical protein Fmac_009485 [Flemingia macrophylla]|uniref:Transmembrane protein n=1 Tax=Flemingia macrophylla TaxID=520843 RepID=A0ABD1N0D9_9FABA
MAWLSEFGTAILVTIALILAGDSAARDLRPSEHGLVFQASPPANSSPEMRSFFSTGKGSSPSLRNATESLPPSWWGVGGGGGGRSKLRRVLTTASLACGVTGGALLVALALLYLFKHRKKQNQNEPFRAFNNNNNDGNNNKLQIVPVVRNS